MGIWAWGLLVLALVSGAAGWELHGMWDERRDDDTEVRGE